MKILLPLVFGACTIIATGQDNKTDTTESDQITSVIWLHSDLFTSLKSDFDEYALGAGLRFGYVGLGYSRSRIAQTVYPPGKYYAERSFLNGYGFLPIGKQFAVYGMLGLWLEPMKTGDAGAGFHYLFGENGMIGIGIHRDFDVEVFVGLQL